LELEGNDRAGAAPASYEEQRRQLIAADFGVIVTVAVASTAIYALCDFLFQPSRFWPTAPAYAIQIVAPLAAWAAVRRWPGQPANVMLCMDLVFTAALASQLLVATTSVSGGTVMLSLKMLATGLFIPWPRRYQMSSSGVTVLFYLTALGLSGRLGGATLHQIIGPILAAMLSTAGSASADRLRRQLFDRATKLEASEGRFRSLIEKARDLVFVLDREGRFTYSSPSFAAGLGYQAEDVQGRSAFELVHPDDVAEVVRVYEEGLRIGSASAQYRVRHADGTYRFFEAVGRSLLDDETIGGIVVNARDITERKRVEQEKLALLEVARDISGQFDALELAERVQRRVMELLPCDFVVTLAHDDEHDCYRVFSQSGLPEELARASAHLQFSRGVFKGRLARGETLVINDVTEFPLLPSDILQRFGVTAIVATALAVRGRRFGVLLALSRGERRFTAGQVQLIESIGRQLSVALEAARLYERQQEEAHVSAALARGGEELISSLDTNTVLDRLCRLTADMLRCDFSHTYFWDADSQAYVAAAGFGDTPEQWEAMRLLRVPRALIPGLVARLERDGLAQSGARLNPGLVPTALQETYGVTHGMFVLLRRRGEPVAIHTAGFRGRDEPFTSAQERVLRGIAHLGSLALENAVLVEELERANRVKSDFVANMSHELRTPLNVIIGYNDLMLDSAFGPLTEDQRGILRRSGQNARELLDLISATLDLSRLDAGRGSLLVEEIDIRTLVGNLEAEMRTAGFNPGVELRCSVADDVPVLSSDAVKLRVILKNVLGNALKFTHQGSVELNAATDGDGVCLTIRDTGIGIPAELQEQIFEPFFQADASIGTRYGGAGLGLHIVRRLVQVLGGAVSMRSAPGQGSEFRIHVPFAPRSDSRAAAPDSPAAHGSKLNAQGSKADISNLNPDAQP
jgi:PAS domain S-box-containing protein